MLARLVERGLVEHRQRGEVVLTDAVRGVARRVMRRHRLWERLLHDVLGLRWDAVHAEACRLEHATSPEVERELARAVGDDATCPHGHAIPDASGSIEARPLRPLVSMQPGERARVMRADDENEATLRQLAALGLQPGADVEMLGAASADPAELAVAIGGEQRTISRALAGSVSVAPQCPVLGSADRAPVLPLSQLGAGETALVRRLCGGGGFRTHCLALGFTPGAAISVVQNHHAGPLLVRLRGATVALGRGEAGKIDVTRMGAAEHALPA
jgi:Mn-dependent DtxR family transcriptional regulator/Fe2+ transport system protein FeoA